MQEIVRETIKDPEDSPIKANLGSELESPLLNQPKFEGVDPEIESRPLKKEVKPLDSNMTNEPIGIQEATIKATSEIQHQICQHYLTQTVEPHSQLPCLTRPILPNQWPNKPPKLPYFIRPKPWLDGPSKHTEHYLRSSLKETRKLTYGEDEYEATKDGKVSPGSNRQKKESVGQIRVFSMPTNPNDRLCRFPNHKEWVVNASVNSQSKRYLIRDIKEVLTSYGMLLRFREDPFTHYLDLPQPLKIHGMGHVENYSFDGCCWETDWYRVSMVQEMGFQYKAIVLLIKEIDSKTAQLIKESEERQLSFCREEFTKIREEIKVGDTPTKKLTEEKSGISKQKYVKYDKDNDGLSILCDQVEKDHVDLHVEALGMEKSDTQAAVVANSKMEESDPQVDAAVKTDGVLPESDAQANAAANSDIQQSIDLDNYPSPTPIVVVPNPSSSVVAYNVPDPNVIYMDHDKKKARKRLSYNCGVFMLKYAELMPSGVKLPWMEEFSQKDIPAIRKTMAIDIFANGQIVDSP
ncbi:hypothetical protein Ddye_029232 [Dipteronia dyeriana]|uniref:Ubiquitin-like protease family profile domain-containing protein n=1 Tax=Dipteronia dyeriana TaxID=168575 RepID=A0AAD9WLH7_9ROSI|nr:hypothetical protein Ddye_029232 [Dipteronia dyeriana]